MSSLPTVWREHRKRFGERPAYRRFENELRRAWAVETGLSEGVYSFDPSTSQLLIEHGLNEAFIPRSATSNRDQTIAQIHDHAATLDALFEYAKSDLPLSTSFIKELHVQMTQHQATVESVDSLGRRVSTSHRHGEYKKHPNNPLRHDGTVNEYCPPEHVDSEMDRLIELYLQHQKKGIAPHWEASWLHHRFSQIHPFQDGNGRVARALASYVFIEADWFPLVVPLELKPDYIGRLEAADLGGLEPLVDFFFSLQKRAFLRALSISGANMPQQTVVGAIATIQHQRQRRNKSLVHEWNEVWSIAVALHNLAFVRLRDIAIDLKSKLEGLISDSDFFADKADHASNRNSWFQHLIATLAKALHYSANMQTHRAWARLVLGSSDRTEILISFHGIGHEFQGVLACSASLFQRATIDAGETEIGPVTSLTDEVFLIHFNETTDAAKARFSKWLEKAIVRGLHLWHEVAH